MNLLNSDWPLLSLVRMSTMQKSGFQYVRVVSAAGTFVRRGSGGVPKFADEVDNVHVRGDIHVLVVGDPGLGKSEMLKVRGCPCR